MSRRCSDIVFTCQLYVKWEIMPAAKRSSHIRTTTAKKPWKCWQKRSLYLKMHLIFRKQVPCIAKSMQTRILSFIKTYFVERYNTKSCFQQKHGIQLHYVGCHETNPVADFLLLVSSKDVAASAVCPGIYQ